MLGNCGELERGRVLEWGGVLGMGMELRNRVLGGVGGGVGRGGVLGVVLVLGRGVR